MAVGGLDLTRLQQILVRREADDEKATVVFMTRAENAGHWPTLCLESFLRTFTEYLERDLFSAWRGPAIIGDIDIREI